MEWCGQMWVGNKWLPLLSLVEIQAGLTEGCVCSPTQERRAAWATGDLFQATLLGDCWVPSLGGQGVEREEEARAGYLSIDLCLSTYSSPLCIEESAEN